MKGNLWQMDATRQRAIEGVALRENERHPQAHSRLSYAAEARIFYGPTMAVSRLLAGKVAVGYSKEGQDRIYLWETRDEADPSLWIRGIFHSVKRRLQWGYVSAKNGRWSDAPQKGEAHWSLYVGALLLAYEDAGNGDVAEVWPLLQEEWREKGELGTREDTREALFVINDFLWQNRFFYIQDLDQVEPLPERWPHHITDMAQELVGRPVPFSWTESQEQRQRRDRREGEAALLDGRFALGDSEQLPPDLRREIPHFLPEEVKVPPYLVELARMIRETSGQRRPLRNILLYGPPGSGKSTAAQILAQLLRLPYFYVNLSLNAEEEVLLGKFVPTETAGRFRFEEPQFVRAFRYGGLVELMELNFGRPGVLGAAHSALETPYRLTLANGKVVERHPHCVVVATMNLGIIGTQRMNEALKSRFQRKIFVEPMPTEDVVDMVVQASGLADRAVIRRMVEVVQKLQRRVEQEGLQGQVGMRELIDWAQDTRFSGDPLASAWHTILPAAAMEHRDIQEELAQVLVENVFGE